MIAKTMLWYPVQRHRLPSRYSRTSRSLGRGLFFTRSSALITMPGVQKPHCSAWLLRKASCIGCSVSPSATPSIVKILRPSACTAKSVQDLTASPSTWTTQAPHWLVSQPTCVPVRPSCSRSSCTKRVRPSTVADAGLPFTVRLTVFCMETSLLSRARTPNQPAGATPRPGACCAAAPGSRRHDSSRRSGARAAFGRHRRDELAEELVGHLARGGVDQPRADLRQLAADLTLGAVAQHRLAALLLEFDGGAALGKAGDSAGALAGNRVARRRIEVGERDLARKARLHRPDLGDDLGGELGVRDFFDGLAPRNALLQRLGIVEPLPDALARGGDAALASHFHAGRPRQQGQAQVWFAVTAIATAGGEAVESARHHPGDEDEPASAICRTGSVVSPFLFSSLRGLIYDRRDDRPLSEAICRACRRAVRAVRRDRPLRRKPQGLGIAG